MVTFLGESDRAWVHGKRALDSAERVAESSSTMRRIAVVALWVALLVALWVMLWVMLWVVLWVMLWVALLVPFVQYPPCCCCCCCCCC